MHSLSSFVFIRILNEDPILKTISVLGTLPIEDGSTEVQSAILLIEKTHFATQSLESNITHRISELISTGSNDIYFWWNAILAPGNAQDPDLKMTVIYPATEAVRLFYLLFYCFATTCIFLTFFLHYYLAAYIQILSSAKKNDN